MWWLAPLAGVVAAAAVGRRSREPVELVVVTGRAGIPPLPRRANLPPDAVVTLLYRVLGTSTEKHVGVRVVSVGAAPGVEYTGLLLDPVWDGLPAGSFVEFGARHVAAIA